MAIPVIAGLPWLAGLIGGLFSSLFSFFTTYFTKRLAIVAAAVLVVVGLTAGLFAALDALLAGLVFTLPAEFTGMVGHFLPSNAVACVSIVTSAKLLRFAYDWNVRVIQWKLL